MGWVVVKRGFMYNFSKRNRIAEERESWFLPCTRFFIKIFFVKCFVDESLVTYTLSSIMVPLPFLLLQMQTLVEFCCESVPDVPVSSCCTPSAPGIAFKWWWWFSWWVSRSCFFRVPPPLECVVLRRDPCFPVTVAPFPSLLLLAIEPFIVQPDVEERRLSKLRLVEISVLRLRIDL